MKKIRILVSAALALLVLAAFCACAESATVTQDLFIYTLNDDGTATLTGYDSEATVPGEYTVPSVVQDHTVTSIGAYALEWLEGLEYLYLPSTIESVEDYAFESFYPQLVDTSLPEALAKKITDGCYSYVTYASDNGEDYIPALSNNFGDDYTYGVGRYIGNSASIVLPDQVDGHDSGFIAPRFAKGNTGLTAVEIPGFYFDCGNEAFEGCTGLQSMDLSQTEILFYPHRMFAHCTGLKEVQMNGPWEGGPSLGNSMFEGCTSLEKISFPYIKSEWDGEYYEAMWAEWGHYTFKDCVNLKTVEVDPAMQIRWLGEGTFMNCSSLEYLALSRDMRSFEYENVFEGCTSLKLGIFHGSYVEEWVLASGMDYEYLDLQSADGYYYSLDTLMGRAYINGLVAGTQLSGAVTVPATIEGYPVVGLASYVFAKQTGITSVVLPDTICDIGESCFNGCSSMTGINMPINDEYFVVGDYAFAGCSALGELYVPNNFYWLGENTFSGCDNLVLIVHYESDPYYYALEYGIPYRLVTEMPLRLEIESACLRTGDAFGVNVYAEGYPCPLSFYEMEISSADASVVEYQDYGQFLAAGPGSTVITFSAFDNAENSVQLQLDIVDQALVLPEGAQLVSAEAFDGDASIRILDLTGRAGVEIGENAFRNCVNLKSIYADAEHNIHETAFDGCGVIMWISRDESAPVYLRDVSEEDY